MKHIREAHTGCRRYNVRYGRELHGLHGVEHQYLIQSILGQISVCKEFLEGTILAHSRRDTRTLAPQGGYSTACPLKLGKVGGGGRRMTRE